MKSLRLSLAILGVLILATPSWALEEHGEVLLQNAVVAVNDGRAIAVDGFSSVALDVTFAGTATISFEGSVAGTGWTSVMCASASSATTVRSTTTSVSGIYQCNVAGLGTFRARRRGYCTSHVLKQHKRRHTATR